MLYCDQCEHKTTGIRQSTFRTVVVHGTPITVRYEGLFCEYCGTELLDDEIEATVFKKVISMYRSKVTSLTPAHISLLLQRHSAEELAAIAQCSATEIINASHGGVLAASADRRLKAVLHEVAS